jgi:hypothetical protein
MTSRTVRDQVREGELVRAGVKAEIESNLNDPLAALQTFVRMALPTHPQPGSTCVTNVEGSLM